MGCDNEVPVIWAVSRGPHPPPQNMAIHQVLLPLSLLRIFMASGDLSLRGLFWTAHFHHSLLGWSRCLFVVWIFWGKKSKTQTVGGNINRLLGSLVFTVPDLHISSWLFLYSLYCISPRDCCFVTFCTIVLAGFVLHTVLKKFHTILCLFFHIYSFPYKFHIEASLIQLFVIWLHLNTDCPFTTLSNVPPKWHDICRCAAALVNNGHNKCHFTKEVSDEQLWTSKIYLGGNNQPNGKIQGKMALSVYESNTNQRFVTSLIKTRWRCLCDHICKLHNVLGFMSFPLQIEWFFELLQIKQLSCSFDRIDF